MKIAQVAPLAESCPPRLYGGTERVVSYLTEELVRRGHEVTLFASGDSITTAVLETVCDQATRLNPECRDPLAYLLAMLYRVRSRADEFDIIHFHTDYLHFPLFAEIAGKTLTTLHGRLDLPDLPFIFREFPMMPLASISDAQRYPLSWANWLGTVHHGLPLDLYRPGTGDGGYLAFLGRMSPEKGPDQAIDIAERASMPIRMAAKVDQADRAFFEAHMKPRLRPPAVDYIGEIGQADKNDFLGAAAAMLFPIDWPEPFGLAVIEAMACGTPVIAFRDGAMSEILADGITGFLVDSVDEAVAALPAALALDRMAIRRHFEERFAAPLMANRYLQLYEQQLVRQPDRRSKGNGKTEQIVA